MLVVQLQIVTRSEKYLTVAQISNNFHVSNVKAKVQKRKVKESESLKNVKFLKSLKTYKIALNFFSHSL